VPLLAHPAVLISSIDLRPALPFPSCPRQHLRDRDLFDRMLVAQAIVTDLDVVSVDAELDACGIRRRW
jgi:PIN domain nuclease of toxin-antitoxin system